MNKLFLLCAAGIFALSLTGCTTCCDEPCCGPVPAMAAYETGYVKHHKKPAHAHHKKHHAKHHHKQPCPPCPTSK